jgi:hypothetical protein
MTLLIDKDICRPKVNHAEAHFIALVLEFNTGARSECVGILKVCADQDGLCNVREHLENVAGLQRVL